jgi:putative transcriptional regulator
VIDIIPKNNMSPKKGRLLISEPFLDDKYFKRSVVLLCEHNEKGSFGFVLNRYVDLKIQEVMDDFPAIDTKISVGGPVQNSNLYYLHTLGDAVEGSENIIGNIYMGGNFEAIKILLLSGKASSDQIRFFVGYSGWTENQLEEELIAKSWYVCEADTKSLMDTSRVKLWKETLISKGKEFEVLANFPEDPTQN